MSSSFSSALGSGPVENAATKAVTINPRDGLANVVESEGVEEVSEEGA